MKLIEENAASILNKSSLLLGESVFTSCLYLNGKILFQEDHFERLHLGVQYLFGILINKAELLSSIQDKLKLEFIEAGYSIRITFVKEGYFLNFRPIPDSKNNLVLGLSTQRKYDNAFKPSYLKLSGYALENKELEARIKCDDLIYYDQNNFLTEATTSNVFIFDENNIVKTPPLSSLVLAGVLRKNLIVFLLKNNFLVQETSVSDFDIKKAKDVFVTNSIRGVRRVSSFENNLFSSDSSTYDYIVSKFGKFGELYYE